MEDGKGEGEGKSMSPLVNAAREQLRTSHGRMGVSLTGDGNEKYSEDPYMEV
jgi:hypothetical protein